MITSEVVGDHLQLGAHLYLATSSLNFCLINNEKNHHHIQFEPDSGTRYKYSNVMCFLNRPLSMYG